ncbi:MAG: GNAT family N-acetyltransferase [Candidatus Latescibacterota bacterium]
MNRDTLRTHPVTLHGARVVLRPLAETDWDVLARWFSDPEVLWYSEGDDVTSRPLEDVQGIYRQTSQTAFCFIIEVGGKPIGEGWLQRMNLDRILARYPGRDCRRIDLMIGEKELWGQGYGTETIGVLTRFGFGEEGADFLFACGVSDHNPRSRRAFQRAGFAVDRCLESPPGAKARWEYDLVLGRGDYLQGQSGVPGTAAPARSRYARAQVEVRGSPIRGQGVFATRPLARGEVVLRIDDSVVIRPDDPIGSKLVGSEPDPCDYLPDGTVVLMQPPERCINHGCEPNVYVYTLGEERFLIAMRPIAAGDELLCDYAIDLVGGDWLDCRCGSPRCRGRHRSDFFLLPPAQQREYLPYLGHPFVRVHQEQIRGLLDGQG